MLVKAREAAAAAADANSAAVRKQAASEQQWWRNAKYNGPAMTLEEHHSWRPSTSENNFLSRNLAEPVADAPLCCARAPAHRHVAPRRPGPSLFTWQRRRCLKGSCIDTRGEGRWWVRSPANSRTRFSERQKSYRKIGGVIVWLFESASGGGPDEVRITLPIIAVLEPTSPCPHRPGTPTHRPIG